MGSMSKGIAKRKALATKGKRYGLLENDVEIRQHSVRSAMERVMSQMIAKSAAKDGLSYSVIDRWKKTEDMGGK